VIGSGLGEELVTECCSETIAFLMKVRESRKGGDQYIPASGRIRFNRYQWRVCLPINIATRRNGIQKSSVDCLDCGL